MRRHVVELLVGHRVIHTVQLVWQREILTEPHLVYVLIPGYYAFFEGN